VDLASDRVVKTIPFPPDVALPTSYLNDVRFDLRRGAEGMAFITDSADRGPNGIVVVDLASGESWRRLHDHPSTKAEALRSFLPVVEGRPFLEHTPDGAVKPGAGMGSDGIAIGADGARLYLLPAGQSSALQRGHRCAGQAVARRRRGRRDRSRRGGQGRGLGRA
jgi:sugar lactone lactonase YvrE